MDRAAPLALNDWAVLGVLVEHERHGFAVARELAADGPLGRVWTVPRPLVYRAIDHLVALELVEPIRTEAGAQGPRRTIMRATRAGRAGLGAWLATPVAHLREVRSELLLKMTLLQRRGTSLVELAEHQLAAFRPLVDGLAMTAHGDVSAAPVADLWRAETSRSVERFLVAVAQSNDSSR